MAFQISPGVNVSEIDLTTIVPAVSSTEGAFAGAFRWGPIEQRVLISSEDELVNQYGKPTANNFETFFTAANFLAYGNQLYISRAAEDAYNAQAVDVFTNSANADFIAAATSTNLLIKNIIDFEYQYDSLPTGASNATIFAAKYAGVLGNSLKISICPSAEAFVSTIDTYPGSNATTAAITTGNTSFVLSVGNSTANVEFSMPVILTSNFTSAVTSFNTAFSANSDLANVATLAAYNAFTGNLAIIEATANAASIEVTSSLISKIKVGDILEVGNTTVGTQYMKVASLTSAVFSKLTNGLAANNTAYTASANLTFTVTFDDVFKQRDQVIVKGSPASANTLFTKRWEYFNSVDSAPGRSNYVSNRTSNTSIADELHIVVADEDGAISGIPGQILEVWPNLSRATDAKGEQGGSIYYRDVLNQSSQYVWSTKEFLGSSVTRENFADLDSNFSIVRSISFARGDDGKDESGIAVSKLAFAYDKFKSAEDIDISLVLAGKARGGSGEVLANYIIDNICESRRDCVAFISPDQTDTVNAPTRELQNVIDYRNLLRSTSYAVLDSGYKYQYDKYNDVYRWVPLNGDTAGLCVRTDNTRDPWFSPAGFNRGQIKNVVKLAFNPDKADRDQLYKNGINPVVNFPGQGVVLYGDKTLLAKPSAFDRINVRRLFIVLEKAIATASKFTLFEFNDEFTRASFRNLVEPFLRDVQGRRGIYDFRVVCDDTNNTPEVIDRNEFRGDIYIKPARSINFIQLNFVAVRTGVEFEEIVGRF